MRKVPKLRFKEFSDEWEEINEEIKILSGNAYPLESYNLEGILLVQGLNIYPGKLIIENPIYISKDFNNFKHIDINNGDILLGLNRPIINNELKVCLFENDKAYLYQRAGILQFNRSKINARFLYQYLRSEFFKRKLEKELVGSDQPYIKSDLFKIIKILSGKFTEQEKIANFLSNIDKKISLTEEKLELFREYKKGVMQKIFSQELRFKDSNGNDYPEWEEKKLEEILIKNKEKNKNNQYTLVQSISNKYGFVNQDEYFEDRKIASNNLSNYYVVKNKNFAYNPSRINVGSLAYKKDFSISVISPLYVSFYADNIYVNDIFLLNWFFSLPFYKQMNSSFEGSVRNNLSYDTLSNFNILLPNLKEQQKIVDFLSSMDIKIENIEKELEKLKEFKKGLLQQMLV